MFDLNGIDPDGEVPPDEVLYHPDDGDVVEVLRVRDGWVVEINGGDPDTTHDGFESAFARFCQEVASRNPEVEV